MYLAQFAIPMALTGCTLALLAIAPSAWSWGRRQLRRDPRLGEPESLSLADDLAELAQLIERVEQSALRQSAAMSERVAALERELRSLQPTPEPRPRALPENHQSVEHAPQKVAEHRPPSVPRIAGNKAESGFVPRARQIDPSRVDTVYALADQKLAPGEIARRSEMPLGEVEVLLGLRKLGFEAAA